MKVKMKLSAKEKKAGLDLRNFTVVPIKGAANRRRMGGAAKPDVVVYAKSLTGFWKRVGVGWRNKTRGASRVSGERAGYLKIQLDFMPPGGELTIWNAGDKPNDIEPDDGEEEPAFDSRQDLAPTVAEEGD